MEQLKPIVEDFSGVSCNISASNGFPLAEAVSWHLTKTTNREIGHVWDPISGMEPVEIDRKTDITMKIEVQLRDAVELMQNGCGELIATMGPVCGFIRILNVIITNQSPLNENGNIVFSCVGIGPIIAKKSKW